MMDDEDDVDIYSGVGQLADVASEGCPIVDVAHVNDGSLSPSLDYILETSLLPHGHFYLGNYSSAPVDLPDKTYLPTSDVDYIDSGHSAHVDITSTSSLVADVSAIQSSEQNYIDCNLDAMVDNCVAISTLQTEGNVIEQIVSVEHFTKSSERDLNQNSSCSALNEKNDKPVTLTTSERAASSNVTSITDFEATKEQQEQGLTEPAFYLDDSIPYVELNSITTSTLAEDTSNIDSYVSYITDVETTNSVVEHQYCNDSNVSALVQCEPTQKPFADKLNSYTPHEELDGIANNQGVGNSTNIEELVDNPNTKGLDDSTNIEELVNNINTKGLDDSTNIVELDDNTNTKGLEDSTNIEELDDSTNTKGLEDSTIEERDDNTKGLYDSANIEELVDNTNTKGLEDSTNIVELDDNTNTKGLEDSTIEERDDNTKGLYDSANIEALVDNTDTKGLDDNFTSEVLGSYVPCEDIDSTLHEEFHNTPRENLCNNTPQAKVDGSIRHEAVKSPLIQESQEPTDTPPRAASEEINLVSPNVSTMDDDNLNKTDDNFMEHQQCNDSDSNKSFSWNHTQKRSANHFDEDSFQEEVDETAPPSAKLRLLEQYALDRFTANSGRQIVKSLEYDVLDDLDLSIEGDYDNDEYPENSSDSDFDEIPEDEIDAMLEEGLDSYLPRKGKRKGDGDRQQQLDEDDLSHEEREKVVLKARGHDHFEVLPEGWLEVTHNSGIPVYLHKQFRVCTLSKPYFLGPGSARDGGKQLCMVTNSRQAVLLRHFKHEIPITAIPCYHYRYERAKESRNLNKMSDGKNTDLPPPACDEESNSNCAEVVEEMKLPSAKIETVVDNNKEKSLDFLQVREYCSRLFEFQTITVRRFKTWAGRRKHQKLLRNLQRPTLPLGTKLITCPLPPSADKDETVPTKPRREFTMNPNGKSHVCILHEYVQHAMRVQPKYIFKELENAKKPYGATVIISDMEYGTGFGSSKKQAKSEAARTTLEILIPQMKEVNPEQKASVDDQQDLAFFDEVRVEDPRVSELCAKAGQPSPYQILLECLKRNYGMGDTDTKLEMNTLKHQKNEFTMTVGKHTAKVICKNKRDGKQRASQAILQALHTHVTSWGSLLRLYGKGSCKTLKEKKQEEQQITELQSRASANRPNQSILNKLREEMIKLKTKQESVKPIGKFMPEDVDLPTSSGSNLKNVDL